jgi:hypothetical protein
MWWCWWWSWWSCYGDCAACIDWCCCPCLEEAKRETFFLVVLNLFRLDLI